MKMSLRQLEVFTAVASHGQVTRAADAIAMTQAAASMALADLERQLGVRLFDRVGRQLRLSDSGRLLLAPALDVLDRARELEQLATGLGSAFDVHLGASVTIGNHLLPAVMARLKQDYPHSRLRVSRHNTEQVVEALLGFRIDLGFIEGPVQHEDLRRFVWRNDDLRLFAAPGHPLTRCPPSIEELARADWVVREHGSGTREVLDRACAALGLVPRVVLELEQPEAIRQCVRAGMGIGCLSALELEDAVQAGWLVALDTPWLAMPRELAIVLHRGKYLSQGLRAVFSACGVMVA